MSDILPHNAHSISGPTGAKAGIFKDKMTYSQRLFHHTYASQNEDAHFIEFRLLQRLNLVQLQNELAQIKGEIWNNMEASEEKMKTLRVTLREYGKSSPHQFPCFENFYFFLAIMTEMEFVRDIRAIIHEVTIVPPCLCKRTSLSTTFIQSYS